MVDDGSMILTEKGLSLKIVRAFLEKPKEKVVLSAGAKKKIGAAHKTLKSILLRDEIHYGINTGFGKLVDKKIHPKQLTALQENIVHSHALSVGEPVEEEVVRLMTLLHSAGLARGFSGVRLVIVQSLLNLLNRGPLPKIPKKGSLGASGDLALLAQLALSLIKKGIKLEAKEGLSLVNGLAGSLAYALSGFFKAEHLIKLADIAAAASIEGDQGSYKPFSKKLLRLKPHPGILATGDNLLRLFKKSRINKNHAHCKRVQDPYSFRCIPQVHGAVKETFHFAEKILERELQGVSDNPLIFPPAVAVVSGGNFHGEAIAFAADFLSIALAELGALSERRLYALLDPPSRKVPHLFLAKDPGLHSGLMVAHYVSTYLALENKSLAQPASIDSLPTSGGQEDHVSQSCFAAQKLCQVAENVEKILAIELWAACRAIKLRSVGLKPGVGVNAVLNFISKKIPASFDDASLRKGYDRIMELAAKEEIVAVAEKAAGKLRV